MILATPLVRCITPPSNAIIVHKTYPAELVATSTACHMVTSAVLLDLALAVRTLLCVLTHEELRRLLIPDGCRPSQGSLLACLLRMPLARTNDADLVSAGMAGKQGLILSSGVNLACVASSRIEAEPEFGHSTESCSSCEAFVPFKRWLSCMRLNILVLQYLVTFGAADLVPADCLKLGIDPSPQTRSTGFSFVAASLGDRHILLVTRIPC